MKKALSALGFIGIMFSVIIGVPALFMSGSPSPVPVFKTGDIVYFKMSGEKGMVIRVGCKYKTECRYLVRFSTTDDPKSFSRMELTQ